MTGKAERPFDGLSILSTTTTPLTHRQVAAVSGGGPAHTHTARLLGQLAVEFRKLGPAVLIKRGLR